MITDIAVEADKEIKNIISTLVDNGFKQVDDSYVEYPNSPFPLYPDAKNRDYTNTIGISFYPELLFYYDKNRKNQSGYSAIPWICCRIEIESSFVQDESNQRLIARWVIAMFKKMGFKPFYDEDSFAGYFKREVHKGWISLKFYLNESYPDGYWENHTL